MHLFVYGTLAPGEPNEHILKKYVGRWENASVKGQLYASGWGAAMGFPGIVLDPNGTEVKGQVFSSTALDEDWATLDAFEGEGYQRVLTPVQLESGKTIDAYIYELSEAGLK